MNEQIVDESCQRPSYAVAMAGLLERLTWVMATRSLKASVWSRNAGLSDSTVTQIKRRLTADPGHQPERTSLDKLAKAAGVDAQWLATGEGSPVPSDPRAPSDPYPSRLPIVAVARAAGVDQAAIDGLLAEYVGAADPGSDYWADRLEYWERHARRIRSRQQGGNNGDPGDD